MGCFLGCFGGEKDNKGRKQRINRRSPQAQRNRFKKAVQQETEVGAEQVEISAEKTVVAKPDAEVFTELLNKPVEKEKRPRSPRKKVTFNSNVTTYEIVPVEESIDAEKENDSFESSRLSYSVSEDENSVISSVGSYPQNHRYYSARDSDDEPDEYGDSDLDDLDNELDDEYDYEDEEIKISVQQVWSESILTESDGSDVQNPSRNDEAESRMTFLPKSNARDRSEYVNSLLNPIENIAQWKAAKSRGKTNPLKAHKENFSTNYEAPRLSFSSEPTVFKSTDKPKAESRDVEVNTSLSSWLISPEVSNKTTSSVTSVEDRPILGAWTVDELKHISATSSPKKSPAKNPDERPIVGSVGTYWNHPRSEKRSSAYA